MREPQRQPPSNQESLDRKLKHRAEPLKPMRKIRIVCNDPDATDSSDDEGVIGVKRPKLFVREIHLPIADSLSCPAKSPETESSSQDSNNGEKEKNSLKKLSHPNTSSAKFRGVRRRKYGKWAAEIRDPFKGRRVWLGTYGSAEEASRAYESKRIEFEAMCKNNMNASEKNSDNVRNYDCHSHSPVDSAGSLVSQVSHPSPSSVLEMDSMTSSACANSKSVVQKAFDDDTLENNVGEQNAPELVVLDGDNLAIPVTCEQTEKVPKLGVMDDETLAMADLGVMDESLSLAQMAIGVEFDMELDALLAGNDFGQCLDDFVLSDFEDIPMFGFNGDEQLPATLPDFDFDFDFDGCNETWMDDAPMMTGSTPLNIACL